MGSSDSGSNTGLEQVTCQQEETYKQRKKKWFLDIEHTPCARPALIYGILGGLAVGILYFAKSNLVRRSCDLAVGGFAIVSLTTWEICRYQKAKQRVELKRAVQVLNSLSSGINSPPVNSSSGQLQPNDVFDSSDKSTSQNSVR